MVNYSAVPNYETTCNFFDNFIFTKTWTVFLLTTPTCYISMNSEFKAEFVDTVLFLCNRLLKKMRWNQTGDENVPTYWLSLLGYFYYVFAMREDFKPLKTTNNLLLALFNIWWPWKGRFLRHFIISTLLESLYSEPLLCIVSACSAQGCEVLPV